MVPRTEMLLSFLLCQFPNNMWIKSSPFEGDLKLRHTRKYNNNPLCSKSDAEVKINKTCVANSPQHFLHSYSLTGRINFRGKGKIIIKLFLTKCLCKRWQWLSTQIKCSSDWSIGCYTTKSQNGWGRNMKMPVQSCSPKTRMLLT